ncbi:mediator of RNA polymerase II transcription subunit 1 isoform X2 [Betta splendens]|nr:mediator of RNA polymerase II transcription subunit 1 isoform X2 [Betta splendens]XP_029001824.1 mediator of RNA polymerase II transcription subunit 1 isoform X2 [Betta splendens]
MKSTVSDLHLKFAEKTWNETFQLVRRCMEKPRDESKPCEPLVRSLERLQEAFNVSSIHTMRSRLEMIAKHQRMGFHITDATCYLTADLFYLEVVLLPCGGVEEVKVAPHGAPAVASEHLLQLLRLNNFDDFSRKLEGLFNQYNIPGDNEVKLKLFTSLQCLGKDLEQVSHLTRLPEDRGLQMDVINNGQIGRLIAGKEDYPLIIQFYIAPSDLKTTSDSSPTDGDAVIQTAQITVGVQNETHRLQMASVIPQPPQLDPQGDPVLLMVNEVQSEALPACFLLRLQPAVPVTGPLMKKLSQVTDVVIPDVDLQWAPLSKLLMRGSLGASSVTQTLDGQDAIFKVCLPGVTHSYIFPESAWGAPGHRGTVIESVPFTHPAQVPALLELLRQQCALNALLSSCITSQRVSSGSVCDLHCEVLPFSETSFSVTFQHPDADALSVLMVNVPDSRQIKCSLFGAGKTCPSVDECATTVMKTCMSIPGTLRALCIKLSASPHLVTTDTKSDHSSVTEDLFAVSPSSSVESVVKPDFPGLNTSGGVSRNSFSAVDPLSEWTGSDDSLSDMI